MGSPILLVLVGIAGVAMTAVTYMSLSGRNKTVRRELDRSRQEQGALIDQLAAAEATANTLKDERDGLQSTLDELNSQRESILGALADEHARREEVEAEADDLRRTQSVPPDPVPDIAPPREADGCWALLLADVERRWAAVVGAADELRGVHLGAVPDQLAEALAREIDRLREEVGVEISLATETTVEPDDPVLFLLAASDLLGLLATRCQRVTVQIDGELTLIGNEWVGSTAELEAARGRVLAAGAGVGPLKVDTDTPRPGPDLPGADALRQADLDDILPGAPDRDVFRIQVAVRP